MDATARPKVAMDPTDRTDRAARADRGDRMDTKALEAKGRRNFTVERSLALDPLFAMTAW
jgi:hypothetical protein